MNDKEIRLLTVLKRHMEEISDEGYSSRKSIISYIIDNLKYINEPEISERISFLVDSANVLATSIELINVSLDNREFSNIGKYYTNSLTITDILVLQDKYIQLLIDYKSLLVTNNINKLIENKNESIIIKEEISKQLVKCNCGGKNERRR